MTKNWENIEAVFSALNKNCSYLVLRNFEQLDSPELFLDGHEDIDILCTNPRKAASILGAVREPVWQHYDHYTIQIQNRTVEIGIRYVGDRYYDSVWAERMLENRIPYRYFYIMQPQDLFYSMLYHALFHKKKLSEDYYHRLILMGEELGLHLQSETAMEDALLQFLTENGYHLCYPHDYTVPIRRLQNGNYPKTLVFGKRAWKIRRILVLPQRLVRKIHNTINRRNKIWVKK